MEEKKYCSIGGQGVIEGIMMKAPKVSALAVRGYDGKIVTKEWETKNPAKKNKFTALPIVRGVVSFADTMVQGVTTITDAAKLLDESMELEPSKFEKFISEKTGKNVMDVMSVIAVIIAIGLSVLLFFVVPNVVIGLFDGIIESEMVLNLLDGVLRLAIFIGYVAAISLMKDVRRMFKYHGAEHRVIACYEAGLPRTVENAQKQSCLHPRCGTSYMLLVMVIAILVFSVFGWTDNPFLRILIRLALLPLIAGIAYEILKAAAKSDNLFWRMVRWPGLQLQRLTTKKPEDEMVEVSIVAFEMALGEKSKEEIDALIAQFDRSEQVKAKEDIEEALEDAEDAADDAEDELEDAEEALEEANEALEEARDIAKEAREILGDIAEEPKTHEQA